MIEITQLDSVVEQHAVSLPLETVGEDDATLGSERYVGEVDRCGDPITDAQIDLPLVRVGECMRLPERHGLILSHG